MSKDALPHTVTGGDEGAEDADAAGSSGRGTGHGERREATGQEGGGSRRSRGESRIRPECLRSDGALVHSDTRPQCRSLT